MAVVGAVVVLKKNFRVSKIAYADLLLQSAKAYSIRSQI